MCDLPAVDYLGYPISLADITPLDIGAVAKHIKLGRRLISVDLEKTRNISIRGETYSVPTIVSVSTDNKIVQGEYLTFLNGAEVAKNFRDDASYPLRYFAVSGTASGARAAQKTFRKGNQFAFFSYTEASYTARLRDYAEFLVEAPLIAALEGFPKPFIPSDAAGVKKYKDFFRTQGSHIIVNANYGARYPLQVWASNKSEEVNKVFNTCVKAKFNGIPSAGDFDAPTKTTSQYKLFEESFQYLLTISGGGDRSKLANVEATYDDYKKWIASIKDNSSDLLSFQVIEMWAMMKFAQSETLRDYADSLQAAFMWIVDHPEIHKTAVTLDIQSDWAEFNLLTPSAVIVSDPNHSHPANTVASDTRVQWGKEYSHQYERQTLRFFVINDGSPLDFSISHGSQSAGTSQGKATVIFAGHNYLNDKVDDNVWNTVPFFNAPVNPEAEPSRLSHSDKTSYTWDEVLEDYLSAEK